MSKLLELDRALTGLDEALTQSERGELASENEILALWSRRVA